MAVTPKVFVQSQQIAAEQTNQYTASQVTAIIDKCTVTNTSASNVAITINIIPSGGVAEVGNRVINARTIAPGEAYTCPEMIGHVLSSGDILSTLATSGGALSLRVSGREVT